MTAHSKARFALLVAVCAIAASVWAASETQRRAARDVFTEAIGVERMLRGMTERESALRGFLATGDEQLLRPYYAGRDRFQEAVRDLRALTEEHERSAFEAQVAVARRWEANAEGAIASVRRGAYVSPAGRLGRDLLMNQFRSSNAKSQRLVGAEREEALSRAGLISFALVLGLGLVFAGIGYGLFARARRRDAEGVRQKLEYRSSQQELAEVLQVTRSEREAHALLKRHLERSVPDATVSVLNRNNSDNRLEATTEIDDPDFAERLASAEPASCVAVRLARRHEQGGEVEPLLACELCGGVGTRSTCVPSLVGGEVIGAVLATHRQALAEEDRLRLDESVSQAAPVLANLRNLALAETRAATDALTGLSNTRAVQETLKRLTAQAGRTASPLTAVLFDVDRFKEINDVHGHQKGDDVLAAVGDAIEGAVRQSDFAGRYGGDEFLVLLPATDATGGEVVAGNIARGIAEIRVAGIDRTLTGSFGVASVPEHAGDAESLVRAADRALYAAKAAGRNCVRTGTIESEPIGEEFDLIGAA